EPNVDAPTATPAHLTDPSGQVASGQNWAGTADPSAASDSSLADVTDPRGTGTPKVAPSGRPAGASSSSQRRGMTGVVMTGRELPGCDSARRAAPSGGNRYARRPRGARS